MIKGCAISVVLVAILSACSHPSANAPTSATNACGAVMKVNADVSPGLSVNFAYAAEQARLAAEDDDRFSQLAELLAQMQSDGVTDQSLADGQHECRELGLALGVSLPAS